AKIAVKNFVAVIPQESASQLLAAHAATDMFRRFLRAREAVAPPARKSGDGSDRVQIHGVWRDAIRDLSLCAGKNNSREIAGRSHASSGRASLWQPRWQPRCSNCSNR